jgi:hypothetical protein
MNKKTIFLITAIVLVLAVFYFLNRDTSKTLNNGDSNFEMSSTQKIDKIFLSNKGNDLYVTLKKIDSTHWTVNDSFKANIYNIELLFEGLRKIRIKRPVAKNEMNMVKKELALNGTKVEIYEKGSLSKVYYVGGNSTSELGTFFYMEGAKEPYLVHIPGFNGYPGARYFIQTKAWRDKTIFGNEPQQIKTIDVKWHDNPNNSFVIDNSGLEPILKSGEKTYTNNVDINLNSIKTYLKFWKNLSFEGFPIDLNPHKIDSISKTQPLLTLSLTDKDGKTTTLRIHKKGIKRDSNIQFDDEGNPLEFDIETFYAFINNNNKEVVQIQDFVFGKVMKTTSDFFIKAKQ